MAIPCSGEFVPSRGRPGVTRRRLLIGGAAVGLAGLVAAPAASAAAGSGFVGRAGRDLVLDGQPWRFAGTNCYYLHQKSNFMIDSVLEDAAAMGLRSVRAWAFADGVDRCEKPIQPEPGVYDDAAFAALDHTVLRAGRLGLRLILPLTNNFPDYGGMAQYVQWARGLDVDQAQEPENHDLFYTDPQIGETFEAWVEHLLTRLNPLTGIRYRDDPTIMAWELANEPRCRTDRTGATLLAWADRTSRLVRRLAPQQLIGVGDEGFLGVPDSADYPYSDHEGTGWVALTNLPEIDYGTLHLYPDAWKGELSGPDRVAWGTAYIRAHLDEPSVAKPVVVGEFGTADPATRDATYDAWTRAAEDGGAGTSFWILTGQRDDGTAYPDHDGFRVVRPSATADLLAAHAARMGLTAA